MRSASACNRLSFISLTLPDSTGATVIKGWPVSVIKTDASGNAVTLNRAGSDTIEGSASIALASQYDKTGVLYPATGGTVWYKWPGV